MKMNKPEIKIENKARFAEAALVIDQPFIETFVDQTRPKIILPLSEAVLPIIPEFYSSAIKEMRYKFSAEEQLEYEEVKRTLELAESSTMTVQKDVISAKHRLELFEHPKAHLETKITEVLQMHQFPSKYTSLILKLLFCNQIDEEDLDGRGLPGRYDTLIRDRDWYWENRRKAGPDRMGYQKIAKLVDKDNIQVIKHAVDSYQVRLDSVLGTPSKPRFGN